MELKRVHIANLEVKFEVEVRFKGLNPLPIFHVAKIERKTTPDPFEVTQMGFNCDPQLHTITNARIYLTPLQDLNKLHPLSAKALLSFFYTLIPTLIHYTCHSH